jgi:Mannosyl-glycoprotein endo-beta-N-acetylglucosaminidase
MRKVRHFLGSIALIIACLPTQKALGFDLAHQYIAQFKDLARQEQRLTGIPASIKLAMALLESGCGQSYLATKGNNHFGIKWWNVANDGAAFLETFDDDKNKHGKPVPSRFIKFSSVEASYKKHSDVLLRPRYQVLFTYAANDYRSWAFGLEACGYATAKGYGWRLIELIEKYDLMQHDLPLEPIPEPISFDDASPTREIGTPQYSTHQGRVMSVSQSLRSPAETQKQPVSARPKTSVESRFVNSKGQVVHYILTEAGEE